MKHPLWITIALAFVLACCGLNSANASMSVNEVEQLIAAGKYDKAEKELQAVIKEYPDSIVAHKYMIEVLKLRHASNLEYTVQYKVHEQEILRIKEDIEKTQSEMRHNRTVNIVFVFILIFATGITGFFAFKFISKRRNEYVRKKEILDWHAKAKAECIQYSIQINSALSYSNTGVVEISEQDKVLLNILSDDHNDVVNCIDNNDMDTTMYRNHLDDVKNFLVSRGFADEKDFY